MTRYIHIDKITEVFDPIIRKIEVHDMNTKHRKRLESRLIDGKHRKPTATESILKQEKKVMLHVTEKQLSILVTSLTLVRFEIVKKSKLRESRETLDIMQTLINMLNYELDVSQGLIKK